MRVWEVGGFLESRFRSKRSKVEGHWKTVCDILDKCPVFHLRTDICLKVRPKGGKGENVYIWLESFMSDVYMYHVFFYIPLQDEYFRSDSDPGVCTTSA